MKIAAGFMLVLLLLTAAASAKKHDPLTEAEADQLRQTALEPDKRIKLLIEFTEARLNAIDQVKVDTKLGNGRGPRIHDLLEDFASLLDEINDNLDQYETRKMDKDAEKLYKKGLKELIAADERFDRKLKALRSSTETDPTMQKLLPDFRFVMQDAEEALKSSDEAAREDSETTHDGKSAPDKKK
jgi:hypothetical protein